MTLQAATLMLPAMPPFEFAKALTFLCGFAPSESDQTVAGGLLTKAIRAAGQTVVFQAAAAGSPEQPGLNCTFFSEHPLDTPALDAAADRVSFYLGLRDDLEPFYRLGSVDPPFAPVIDRLYGYHQVKFASPFENACWAVLVQRLPMPIAQKIKHRLLEHFGNAIAVDGHTYYAFPDVQQMTSCTRDELKRLIENERKAQYMEHVSQAFAEVDEQFLRTGPYAEVKQWLLNIRGIGEWSALFILIRGLGRTEEAPPDKALLRAASKVYGGTLTEEQFREIARHYNGLQGYWGHYLRVYA